MQSFPSSGVDNVNKEPQFKHSASRKYMASSLPSKDTNALNTVQPHRHTSPIGLPRRSIDKE